MKCKYLFFLFSLLLHEVQGQDTLRIALENAIEMAIKGNKNLQISNLRTESAKYSVREALGNLLPKVNLSGTYNRNMEKQVIFLPASMGLGGPVRIGADNNYTGALDVSMPLYAPSVTAAVEYSKANLDLQKEISKGTKLALVNQTKKTYFSYLVALETVKVMEKSLDNAEANLRNVVQLYAQGRVTEYDETTAKAKVTSAKNNLLLAKNNLIPSENALKNLLGLGRQVAILPTGNMELSPEETLGKPKEGSISQNSDLRQKELSALLQQKQLRTMRANYYPTLSAVGNYQYISQENNFEFSNYRWIRTNGVGLQLQVPLFKGLTTRNRVNQAILNYRIATEQKEFAQNEKSLAYQELESRLDYTKQRIALQEENKALSAKALSIAKERYAYGRATLLEVNDAEYSLTLAHLNWLQAMLDYKTAYYDVELITGIE